MTKKQMGDAWEMLMAAEMTLAGVPASKMPDNWPGYDVIAQPPTGGPAQRISVKTRTFTTGANFVEYRHSDLFDWLAIVLLKEPDVRERRQFFVVPRHVVDATAHLGSATAQDQDNRWWSQQNVLKLFAAFENNFRLSHAGAGPGVVTQLSPTILPDPVA